MTTKEISQEDLEILASKIKAVRELSEASLEICGTWLWVGGNTKQHREALKALGFRWACKKKLWYFHVGAYRRGGRKFISKKEIDEKYGCEKIF